MEQLKPIAIYTRYFSDLQNERSCEDQIIECKQYIERQDDLRGRPIEIFTDNAISGSYIRNRPCMVRLMEAIKQQKIAAIVSESLDRISRSLSETDEIFRLWTYYGIPIFTVMEGRIEKIKVGLVWNRHNRAKHPITGLRRIRPNPKEIWLSNTCEDLRIISDEQWNKVQHLIQKI